MIDFQVEEPVCVGQSAKWFDGRRHAIHQETNVAHVCPALQPQPVDVGVCPLDSDRDVHGGERTGKIIIPVIIVHVGGTRCVTSSTDNMMKIQARITLTVECIRGCIFLCLVDVSIQGRV